MPKGKQTCKILKEIRNGVFLSLFLNLVMLAGSSAIAQETDTVADFWWGEDVCGNIPQQMPYYPGGDAALYAYINEHLIYPQEALDADVSGRVFVGFVVEIDGSLSHFKVLKGLGYGCDEAALEAFKGMPAWIPAIEREKPIACKYVLPIVFKEANLEEMEIISAVEKMPEYIGGTEAMYVFIHTHLEYPQEAKDAGVEGRVFVSFWVDVDGSLKGIEVMKGIGYGCDEAAMAVMRKMPLWKPGEQRGKPIKVRYTVPIQFKLSDTDQRK